MFNKILIVCVGNICRSPMAEALLMKKLEHHSNIKIESAGIGALVGHEADSIAQSLMQAKGVDISEHRARQLNSNLLGEFDLVLVMENGHMDAIHQMSPESKGKVHLLGKWNDFEIPDPYKQGRREFEVALELINRGVDEWVENIWPRT